MSGSTMSLFFFDDTSSTEIYTLSLHDALPISGSMFAGSRFSLKDCLDFPLAVAASLNAASRAAASARSEEHTSELQSLRHLVCRLLLEKKKKANERTGCYAARTH